MKVLNETISKISEVLEMVLFPWFKSPVFLSSHIVSSY